MELDCVQNHLVFMNIQRMPCTVCCFKMERAFCVDFYIVSYFRFKGLIEVTVGEVMKSGSDERGGG